MVFFYIPWQVILLIIGVLLCAGYLAVQEVISLIPILLLLILAIFSHYSRRYLLSVFLEYGILIGSIHAIVVFSVRAIACYMPFIVYYEINSTRKHNSDNNLQKRLHFTAAFLYTSRKLYDMIVL